MDMTAQHLETGSLASEKADYQTIQIPQIALLEDSPHDTKNNNTVPYEDDGASTTFSTSSKSTFATEAKTETASSCRLRRSESFDRRVPSLDDDLRSHGALQELTINKLQFDSIGLVDREKETKVLKSALNRMTTTGNKELVVIQGPSGVGKTSLAATIQEEVAKMGDSSLVAEGKFHLNSTAVPYSAIATAFGKICESMHHKRLMSDDTVGASILALGRELVTKLGEDTIHLLTKLIPQLDLILPNDIQLSNRQIKLADGSFDVDAAKIKWENAFRVMTRELNSLYTHLVIVLDNLHWADASSLNVIDYLMTDTENENSLMILACYRSNEVDEKHILRSKLADMEPKEHKFKFQTTNICLANLHLDGVHRVIMALLASDDPTKTRNLAEVCFKRSLGNPYFLIEFVSLLEEEGLLEYNLGTFEWKFDATVIYKETMSTANVVDLLQLRMKKLTRSTQLVLQYAACLGQRVKYDTLCHVWSKLGNNEENLEDILFQLEKGHFLERLTDNSYRWVHIKVKETALLTGDAAEPTFQFEVGCTLYHEMSSDELEDVLFEVTDLINTGGVERRIEFAELNLRAAEKAKRISAFNSAANYVTKGIAMLPNDKWKNHKELTLRLFIIGVQMELALGRIDRMETYSTEVLSQSTCTPLEKSPVYLARCYELLSISLKPSASIEFGLMVLKNEFGVKFGGAKAFRPVTAIKALLQTIKRVKRLKREYFENLGEMTDPNHLVVMDLISRVSYSGYFGKDVFIQILCTVKQVQMTLDHGFGVLGGFPFISLAVLTMAVTKDNETGAQFTELGFMLQERCKSETATSAAIFVANNLIYPWTNHHPLQICRQQLLEGYTSGMRAGNSEMGMWCHITSHVIISFQVGRPLRSILSKCFALSTQCEQLKLIFHEIIVRIHWQLILDLMGMSDERMIASGQIGIDTERLPVDKVDMQFKDIHLLVFLGDYEAAASVALDLGDSYDKTHTNVPQVMSVNFLRGVALYAMARKTGKRKYRRHAKRVRDKIGGWLKAGNPNVSHFYPLLCAEQAALDRKHEEAKRLYHDAIVLSARTGHIQFAGLANERYADFCRHDLRDEDEAMFRIGEAIKYYREWGADPKVELLEAW